MVMLDMVKKISIGLVQINNKFSGQIYLPYSIACLQSYAEQYCDNIQSFEFLEPVFKRDSISEIVEHLRNADIVGFSIYVWNVEISLEIARRLKLLNPDVFILAGGPQVPDHAEDFLKENTCVDICIHNEGENKFAHFLELYPTRDLASLAGASYLDGGIYVRTSDGPRIKDLNTVPSPFLNGMFDQIIANNPDESWIGLWETNRGCPFTCTFCDWGSATAAKLHKFDEQRLYKEVDWFSDNKIEYIFCCDANFGILPRDIEIAKYTAKLKKTTGYPVALSVQNTKNATERAYEAQKILADAGLNKGVALSMQSVDLTTLEKIRRQNISLDTYWELSRRFTKDKVETYSDLILGLPGETYASFTAGVDTLMNMGQHNRIQFNNLSILPNSEMGNPEYIREHGLKTVRSEIINIHGSRIILDDDVPEWQELVIASGSTPEADWRRTRAFSWMTAFLHFDKIFQLPLITAHESTGIAYAEIIEAFLSNSRSSDSYPLLCEIADFFEKEAENIQKGLPEYVYSEEWLGIYWPADEYMYIKLTTENNFEQFYLEAGKLLAELLKKHCPEYNAGPIEDAIKINKSLLSQPNKPEDISLSVEYNIVEFCTSIKEGGSVKLEAKQSKINIKCSDRYYSDLQQWCQEVVWWGNKKGAYLYNCEPVEKQMAGHY